MKQKIAFITYYFSPYMSGLSEYARSIAEELVNTDLYDVDVLVTLYDKNLKREEKLNGMNIKRFKTLFSLNKWVFAPGLFWYLFKNRKSYDKIFIFLPFAESGIIPLLFPSNKIYAFYVCDIRVGKGIISKIIEKVLFGSMQILLNKAKKIIPLSKDYFYSSRAYKKEYEAKVFPINPTLKMTEEEDIKIDYRKKLNIDKETYVIGFLGRIVYEKGVDYLINAIPYLLEKGMKDFKIILGGDYQNIRGGSVFDELKSSIEKYKDYTVVTGFIPANEKQSFFKSLDVFVLPSIDPLEAFGIVQLESMSQGVPVISSALPGVREVVQRTGFGLLTEPKSSEDLADNIFKLYSKEVEVLEFQDKYKDFYNAKIWRENVLDSIL